VVSEISGAKVDRYQRQFWVLLVIGSIQWLGMMTSY